MTVTEARKEVMSRVMKGSLVGRRGQGENSIGGERIKNRREERVKECIYVGRSREENWKTAVVQLTFPSFPSAKVRVRINSPQHTHPGGALSISHRKRNVRLM